LRYRLTKEADEDYFAIYDYGIGQFGKARADAYMDGVDAAFESLTVHPRKGAAVDYIRAGYRRFVYQSHSIYYRIEDAEIVIVRLLGRQNAEDQLGG